MFIRIVQRNILYEEKEITQEINTVEEKLNQVIEEYKNNSNNQNIVIEQNDFFDCLETEIEEWIQNNSTSKNKSFKERIVRMKERIIGLFSKCSSKKN
jgi:hypothetical protein